MKRTYRKYTNQEVIEKSKIVKSIAGLLKELGLKPAGGNYSNIKKLLQQLKVNTDHWTGQAWNKDQQLKDWSEYTNVKTSKKHLLKLKGNKCEKCNLDKWLDSLIPLEVHHEDGNKTNNNLINLKLVCPNCHALTDFYRGAKNKKAVDIPH